MISRLFTSSSNLGVVDRSQEKKKRLLKLLTMGALAIILQFAVLEIFERFLYTFETTFIFTNKDQQEQTGTVPGLPPVPTADTPMYTYDEYGFRTWGIDYAHKKGKRIVFVGSNSIGMGYGVQVHESFPSHFWKTMARLRPNTPIEVINVNLPGNPLPKNMTLLKDIFIDTLQADVIVYGEYLYKTDHYFPALNKGDEFQNVFDGGDINFATGDTQAGSKSETTQAYLEHSDLWYYLVDHSLLMAKFLSYIDAKLASLSSNHSNVPEQSTHLSRAGYLNDLNQFLKKQDIPFLVIALPNTEDNKLHRAIYEVSKDQGIPYFPLDKKRDFDTYSLVEEGHYSAQTNALLGSDIAAWFDSVLDSELKVKRSYVF